MTRIADSLRDLQLIFLRRTGIARLTAADVIGLFLRHTPAMHTSVSLYRRHRFPAEIISHCVWLYFRFTLSFRDVEEMLAMRGVTLSYETVREWCLKFGQTYANGLRRRSPRPGDRWHLDEVFLKINGRVHYLWRAVDQDGDVLDILVQSRRDKKAAKKFFRKLLKGLRYVPRVIITDKLKSYSAAKAEVMPSVEHLQQKYQNNRSENSHQMTRLREKVMRRFKSAGQAQRFLSAFGIIASHFRVGRHLYRARGYRAVMKSRFAVLGRRGCRSRCSLIRTVANDQLTRSGFILLQLMILFLREVKLTIPLGEQWCLRLFHKPRTWKDYFEGDTPLLRFSSK